MWNDTEIYDTYGSSYR